MSSSFSHSRKTDIIVKHAEVHAETLNVITAIKLSDTDNVVELLSKLSHSLTMISCVNLEMVTSIVK